MNFLRWLRRSRRAPETLIDIRIHRDAILSNLNAFKSAYGLPVAPVLKSNAYGHGLVEVAEIVEHESPLIVVDSLYEAGQLRHAGIGAALLVVGYTRPDVLTWKKTKDISVTITSLDGLKAYVAADMHARVHIKLDTGMRRQGLMRQDWQDAIRALKNSRLELEGICSHFADADGPDEAFTRTQIKTWNEAVQTWRSAFPEMRYWHIAATAGAAYSTDFEANMIRLGTGLYGFPRHATQTFSLRPALSKHSVITGIKDLAVADKVGYNGTFTAEKPMRIATVPVGYFEGVDRRLSNKGCMLVAGVSCPIVGRVSMNITSIDVSSCTDARLETLVTVFSDDPESPNCIKKLADICETTPLELLVHIPQHLRRTVV